MIRAPVLALLPSLLATLPAFAQDRPAALPTRDVDVTYRTEQGGQVIEQRSRFDAATQRTRLDMPTPGLYSIMDYRARTMAIVSDPDRGVLDVQAPPGTPGAPSQPGAQPGAQAGAQAGAQPGSTGTFARRGNDQVAGLPCTEWESRDSRGQTVLTCFTADGVMLRVRHGTQVLAVATRVAYGRMDPALFTPPPGYGHVTPRAPGPAPSQ